MPLRDFHPAVSAWFEGAFPTPTGAQAAAWPAIRRGEHTLVAAPTGSGKTLTAFLAALDALVVEGLSEGGLEDRTQIVYISPLKALSNDIQINLEVPLAGIRAQLKAQGLPDVDIRTGVRTGDTPTRDRDRMRRRPPHILVTTPESLYVLLGSDSGRAMLGHVRTVIVDEIHAIAAGKRGSHLSLSLERLQALCPRPLQRIALSATQKPIEAVARFLVGASAQCTIIDTGHARPRDLGIEVPVVPLEAVMSNDTWELVYNRLANLVEQHRTTLVFVNTRRLAERVTRHLSDRLGREHVAAHHGSLSREQRLDAEQRLKAGSLKVLVATASLELGIDIGDVDLVCQLASPRSISAFLQRSGRSGHAVNGTPKARLFPNSRDDLIECTALLNCVRRGELDTLRIPNQPLDVLAQQIVAEVSVQEWDEDALFAMYTKAAPFAGLARGSFDDVVRMLADGFTTRLGPRGAYVHRDAVHRRLRARKGAKMTAVMSGGTIPDMADYAVVLEPQAHTIGSVNEDFAVESMAGDVFQLGNTSYRILRVERDKVRVEDAHGAPPSIPFWLGEAPGRSDELSMGVARLREEIARELDAGGTDAALAWLTDTVGINADAAAQIVDYLARAKAALGVLPTQSQIVLERFFDESGGTQLIVHTPFGSRVNRAWGLALRKRFCRKFNFELQAAATEDAIILSLSTSHSFPLDEVSRYLHSATAEDVLVQALLDAPLFGVRWRWNATTALALPRFSGGKKTAPQLQRMKSEDFLATVFPDQVACAENLVGEREVPEHPLVAQTLDDCLHEAMDSEGWLAVLRRMESGAITIVARDLPMPSPLAAEVLSAAPYAFLDDAPLEERRTQAVQSRRWGGAASADDMGRLDETAIDAVRAEAWPEAGTPDEMHEALNVLGGIDTAEAASQAEWPRLLALLAKDARATALGVPGRTVWVAAERLPVWQAVHPDALAQPAIAAPADYLRQPWTRDDAIVELLRSRLAGLGPVTMATLAADIGVEITEAGMALGKLQTDGYVMAGQFSALIDEEQWCERHLLARIHRYTIGRLRREIEPVSPRDFMRFLLDWQHVSPATRVSGPDALAGVIAQLEGFEAAAGAWESELLPTRVEDYGIHWLDDLCRAGRVVWSRLRPGASDHGGGPVRSTPIVLLPRRQLALWGALAPPASQHALSSRAQAVADALRDEGALFFDELAAHTRLLRTELEDALGELVAAGRVTADSFAGLRALLLPAAKRDGHARRTRRHALSGIEDSGRWSLARRPTADPRDDADTLEHVARTLLRRYGVVTWRLLEREAAWLPPWRELRRVYQRLEARGEIRGGRFIDGMVGEQFALPDALTALRQVRARPYDEELTCVSGCDPLNLLGTLLAGAKVPAVASTRIAFQDGVPVAAIVAGKFQVYVTDDYELERRARQTLTRAATLFRMPA